MHLWLKNNAACYTQAYRSVHSNRGGKKDFRQLFSSEVCSEWGSPFDVHTWSSKMEGYLRWSIGLALLQTKMHQCRQRQTANKRSSQSRNQRGQEDEVETVGKVKAGRGLWVCFLPRLTINDNPESWILNQLEVFGPPFNFHTLWLAMTMVKHPHNNEVCSNWAIKATLSRNRHTPPQCPYFNGIICESNLQTEPWGFRLSCSRVKCLHLPSLTREVL